MKSARHRSRTAKQALLALAIKIADESALCSIESACACDDWKQPDELRWWMTDQVNTLAVEHVKEAVKYLEMRGVLEHHPDHPTWVRWPA